MKKRMIFGAFPLAVAAVACLVLLPGCSSVRQLDTPKFLDQARQISEMHRAQN